MRLKQRLQRENMSQIQKMVLTLKRMTVLMKMTKMKKRMKNLNMCQDAVSQLILLPALLIL